MTKVEQAQRKARGDSEAPGPAKQEATAPSWRGKGKERGARTSVQSFRSRNTYLFLPVPHPPVSCWFLLLTQTKRKLRGLRTVWAPSPEVSSLGYRTGWKGTARGFEGKMDKVSAKPGRGGSGKALLGSTSKELFQVP